MITQNNNNFTLGNFTNTYKVLPIGTYRLQEDGMTGQLFLEKTVDFEIPKKLYGNFDHIDRVVNKFNAINKSLGVLFNGQKGSGKTIDAKLICKKLNLPVIIIDKGYKGSKVASFLANSEFRSCIIFIDEVEKIFNGNYQTEILPILDGIFSNKHLFLLTSNDTYVLDSNLFNRPSRIFYRKDYGSLPDDLVNQVLEAELINKQWKSDFLKVLQAIPIITFDILMALLDEVNMYDESPLQSVKMMNLESGHVDVTVYQQHLNGERTRNGRRTLSFNTNELEVLIYKNSNKEGDYKYDHIPIKDIKKVKANTWEYRSGQLHLILIHENYMKLLL